MKKSKILRRGFCRSLTAALCLLLMAPVISAAPDKPAQLEGDVITYTSRTGIMTAQGGVKLTQGNAVLTGDTGQYNAKTTEAVVTGNVKLVKDDSTLTAAEVRSLDAMKHLIATGNALLIHKNGTAAGPRMEYFTDRQYAMISGGSRLTNQDAVITSQVSEAFFQEDRATADGNVHIVSNTRKLDAVADHAVYYGINGKNGKADLIGNVRAVQDGNVLTGNHVVLYLDDNALDTEGRSTLVITPQAKPAATPNAPEKSKGNL